MRISLEKSEVGSLIRLEGAIDIGCAGELKATLVDACSAAEPVRIDIAQTSYLDVTAIQLLWAAKKVRPTDSGLQFQGHASEALTASLANAGFAGLLNAPEL